MFNESQAQAGFLGLHRKVFSGTSSEVKWFDQIYKRSWILLSPSGDAFSHLSVESRELFEAKLGGKSVWLKESNDFEGKYKKWFEEHDEGEKRAEVMLIRPDYYVAFVSTFEGLQKTFDAFLPGLCLNL